MRGLRVIKRLLGVERTVVEDAEPRSEGLVVHARVYGGSAKEVMTGCSGG